jgi:hypothetical protein
MDKKMIVYVSSLICLDLILCGCSCPEILMGVGVAREVDIVVVWCR